MTTKTIPCKFYQKGLCRNGNTCQFDHSSLASRAETPIERPGVGGKSKVGVEKSTAPCHYFYEGRCMKGDKCPRRHEPPMQPIRESRICSFFLEGNCAFGNTCRRAHSLDPTHFTNESRSGSNTLTQTVLRKPGETVEAVSTLRGKVTETHLASGKFEKVLIGATRAIYGAGAQLEELFTGEQSRRFVIENLKANCNTEVVKKAVQETFGPVNDIKVIQGADASTAIVTMSTIQEAEQAVGVLKLDIPEAIRGVRPLSVYGIPETTETQKAHLSSTIEISCHYPSRLAWAHYRDERTARAHAARVNATLFGGREITATLQEAKYTYTYHHGPHLRPKNFTVNIANLPENVTEEHLVRRLRANDVSIQRPQYTTERVKRYLTELLPTFGTLLSWEMAPILPGTKKLYAFARYSSVQESRMAMKALTGPWTMVDTQPEIKLYCSLVNSIKYAVRNDVWRVLEKHVRAAISESNNPNNGPFSFVRLSLYDSDESMQVNKKFRIYGKDIKALGKVKNAVDDLVRGEVFLEGDSVFWHEVFETAAGTLFLNNLVIPPTVAVSKDMRTRTIRFYGDVEPRNAIKAMIVTHVKSVEAEQTRISLNRSELRCLLSGGLRSLQRTLGHETVRLDVTKSPELLLKKKDMAQGLALIRTLATQEPLTLPQPEDCSICTGEIEDPIALDCGHACCHNCITHYISSTLRTRSIPVSCITCSKPIALPILRQFRDFDELLLASFKRYILSNPIEFENCPTADCPQVYRIGSTTETVVQCSECLAEICTSCKVTWHEGMSCSEMREAKDPDNVKNKELMRQLGIRPCPRCKTNIEKTDGCNHMTCGGCQTHICWYCMRDFGLNNGALVYEHMRKEHGREL